MKINHSSIGIIFLTALMMLPSIVLSAPKARILEYGFYEFTKGSERVANAATTSGFVTRGAASLVEETKKIPLKKGRLFGFKFLISGMDKTVGVMPVELVVTHPKITKPDGSVSTGYRYFMKLTMIDGKVEDKTGYRMNEKYEMVEGDWHFQYRFMKKTLIEQTFTTFQPKKDVAKKKE